MKFKFISLICIATISTILCLSPSFADEGKSCADAFLGATFLHEKNPRLQNTLLVNRAAVRANLTVNSKPKDKIQAWIAYLEQTQKKALTDPSYLEKLKQFYFKAQLIKIDEIPQSYFDLQVRIAREQGHGNISITAAERQRLATILIGDQKKSLESWIEYLLSPDSASPMWAKYWCFEGLLKLGKFDQEKGEFSKRSRSTTEPFAELNREALAYVMDAIIKKVNGDSLDSINDPEFIKLLEGANFGKMYAYDLKSTGKIEFDLSSTNGKWVKFEQGSDPPCFRKDVV